MSRRLGLREDFEVPKSALVDRTRESNLSTVLMLVFVRKQVTPKLCSQMWENKTSLEQPNKKCVKKSFNFNEAMDVTA